MCVYYNYIQFNFFINELLIKKVKNFINNNSQLTKIKNISTTYFAICNKLGESICNKNTLLRSIQKNILEYLLYQ